MKIGNWLPIVKVGGEGGSLTLQGRNLEGEWEFRMAAVEIFEDEWMGKRSFYRLYPTEVHPDFAVQVWQFVLQWAREIPPHQLGRWLDDCCRDDTASTAVLALWLKLSRSTVVLTGAGMSTESGVPDFR